MGTRFELKWHLPVYTCLNFGLPLQRSRHSSGQSVTSLRAMRTNSQEGLKKRPVLTPTDSPVNQQKQPREELWHIDLRHNFLRQYIKYVQSLGFISVTLLPNLHSKGYILQGVLTSLSSINFKYYLVHVYLIIFYCYKESCIG